MEDSGKLVLRLTTAGLILFHGVSKILRGVSFMDPALAAFHLPAFVAYGVYIGEVIAPIFLLIGLWTRVASLVVAVNMIFAVALEAWRLAPTLNRGGGWGLELEAFYFLVAVAVFFLGPGKYSVSRGEGVLR